MKQVTKCLIENKLRDYSKINAFVEEQAMKKIVAGIVAHVDAGKTTLSEALLYQAGTIHRLGRVDHQDSFLDPGQLEKSGG